MLFIFISMKRLSDTLLVFLVNLFCCFTVNAQMDTAKIKSHDKIDDIKTSREIEDLLKSLNPTFSTFHINDSLKFLDDNCKRAGDSLHCSPWFKADLDNNCYTDLVVVGGWDNHAIFCILDSGDNKYAINR